MRAQKGFTLVEILIVVVILGILAAIVIPQFTNASTQAKENSLKADLQTLRSQIELYKIQHGDAVPGTQAGNGFVAAMTGITDKDGNLNPGAGVVSFGPYMKKLPSNPFATSGNEQVILEAASGATVYNPAATVADTAWWFNTDNGAIAPATAGTTDAQEFKW